MSAPHPHDLAPADRLAQYPAMPVALPMCDRLQARGWQYLGAYRCPGNTGIYHLITHAPSRITLEVRLDQLLDLVRRAPAGAER